MTIAEYTRLIAQIAVLKEVAITAQFLHTT